VEITSQENYEVDLKMNIIFMSIKSLLKNGIERRQVERRKVSADDQSVHPSAEASEDAEGLPELLAKEHAGESAVCNRPDASYEYCHRCLRGLRLS